MIIIGLTIQVSTDAELKALTGMSRNDIVYHNGCGCAFTYEPKFGSGEVQSDAGGYWMKDDVEALDLAEYKELRIAEIKEKTKELISQGFLYNSVLFSLSYDAQIGLVALHESKDDPAILYPQAYGNIDDTVVYQIANSADLHGMYLTALGTKKHWLETEDVLKSQIKNAVDESAVQAIIDNR